MSRVAVREVHDALPSTQDRAVALARAGGSPGTTVIAHRQTRGRGRLDHAWHSPPGGVYLSRILGETGGPEPLLSLGVANALEEDLETRYGLRPVLKWPNDVLVPGSPGPRKLAGVLLDRVERSPAPPAVVVGVGVNVLPLPEPLPPGLSGRATSLAELVDPTPPLEEVAELVEASIDRAARALASPAGRRDVLAACRRRLYGRGRPARLDGAPAGTIRDLDEEGALVLEGPAGPVVVRAGELVLEEGP